MADSNAMGREAAYGPPAAVLQALRHFRQRELPATLGPTTLTQIGVKDSLQRLVWRSLEFLGLIEEDGTTTDRFRALRFATDEQYGQVLADTITSAYADVIAVAPPESATRLQLLNAFRPYKPASQHNRMIGLFLALCAEAGMPVAQPAKRSAPRRPSGERSGRHGSGRRPVVERGAPARPPEVRREGPESIPTDPLIAALVSKLPPPGGVWPAEAREEFIAAFKAIAPIVWRES